MTANLNLIDEIMKDCLPKSIDPDDNGKYLAGITELLEHLVRPALEKHLTPPTSPAVKDSQPKEVVAPVDIDEILNEYFTDTMRGTPRVELERILRKHLKGTTPVEPINQERLREKDIINNPEYEKMNYIEKAVYGWRGPRCTEKMDGCCICKAREMYDAMDGECTLAAIRRGDFVDSPIQSESEVVQGEVRICKDCGCPQGCICASDNA